MSAEDDTAQDPEEIPAGADPVPGKPISVRAERGARMTPAEAVRDMRITLPARGNRTLRDVVDRANHDMSLKALWHAANVNAVTRLQTLPSVVSGQDATDDFTSAQSRRQTQSESQRAEHLRLQEDGPVQSRFESLHARAP